MFTTYYISLHLWLKYSSSTIFYNSSSQGIHIDETFPHIFFCLIVIAAILGLFLTDFQKTQCEHEKYCRLSLSAFNLYDHLNYSPIMQVLCKASCACIGHKLSLKILTQAFLEFCKKKKKQPILDFMSFDSRQNHKIFCGCLHVLLRTWRRAPVLCHCRNPWSVCSRQVRHCSFYGLLLSLIWDWQFGVVQLEVVSFCRFQYSPRSFLMFSSSAVPFYYVIPMHFHSWETS